MPTTAPFIDRARAEGLEVRQRDHLRSVEFRLEPTEEKGILTGYGAVFDQRTSIVDWLGEYDEVISRGAFTKTIAERTPVVQFDHGKHPMYGSLPIAAIRQLREDDHGLYLKARMFDAPLFEALRQAISEGAISGMSFRFQVVREEWDEDQQLRTIKEVRLFELGPVVFPAYSGTSLALRSLVSALPDDERATVLSEFSSAPVASERTTQTEPECETDTPSEAEPSEQEAAPDALVRTTQQDRRHMAAVLRGMQTNADAA